MKRKVIDELIKWKDLNNIIPILLTGAKGVGKTYLAYDFAKAFFERICYLNFEREAIAERLFYGMEPVRIKEQLTDYFHIDTDAPIESRVLILDEISNSPNILYIINSKDFADLFQYIIVITSNNIAKEYTEHMLKLAVYPLEFDEFLRAISNDWYIETIINHYNSNKKIPEIVHKELLALYQLYLQIGGMPASVNDYLNLSSLINISEQHGLLIGSYHDYIQKNNPDSEALKMIQVFDSLVYQLNKENRKFQYKLIRKGTTHAMYKDAIHRLYENNYIIKCNRISSEELNKPLDSLKTAQWCNNDANTHFKLYMPDTGMLHSMLTKEQSSTQVNQWSKALLENNIAQTLRAKDYLFGFWESDSMAKIDFIILKDKDLIPVELHESDQTRSKSISVLKQKCSFPYAIKISSKNFEYSNDIKYVPYYATFCI